tara:strand:+ start:168 stop:791 length:624 start_codon:yes stop_codon:yes gene_type:complete
MKIEEVDIDTIKPYKNNPREIPIEAVEKVKQSIREFGNNQPIVVDKDNVIVVGHTRWRALKNLGKTKAFIIKKNFNKSEAIAYRIMDNRSGENSKWDKSLLKQEIDTLKDTDFNLDMTGFTFDELDKIMENNPIFKAPNDMIADINTDSIQAPNSSVKMMQLFFTTETEKKFREMVKELQEEYNKTNVTDTVFTIVEKEYKLYKDEK